jgi:hypothetical protein
VEAARHATAHILARDVEFNIALRQVFANSARHSLCYNFTKAIPDFQISLSTPAEVFHIAVTSPNPVILIGSLQKAKVTVCDTGLFDCDIKSIGPQW